MKLITYLFQKQMLLIYGLLSGAIAFLFTLTAYGDTALFAKMFCMIYVLLWILRVLDDINDFALDYLRKKQPLTKRQLTFFLHILVAAWICLHLIWYDVTGILCLAALGYILLWKYISILKTLFMAVMFALYWILNQVEFGWIQVMILLICPAVSLIYATIKKRKQYEHTSKERKTDD